MRETRFSLSELQTPIRGGFCLIRDPGQGFEVNQLGYFTYLKKLTDENFHSGCYLGFKDRSQSSEYEDILTVKIDQNYLISWREGILRMRVLSSHHPNAIRFLFERGPVKITRGELLTV